MQLRVDHPLQGSVIVFWGDGRYEELSSDRFGGLDWSCGEQSLSVTLAETGASLGNIVFMVIIETSDGIVDLNECVGGGIMESSGRDFDLVASACSRAKTEKFCRSLTRNIGKNDFRGQILCSVGSVIGIWRSSAEFWEW